MRASHVTRRIRSTAAAAEEKKDDHHHSLPVTTYPGAPKLRRRRKSKERNRWKRQIRMLVEFSPAILALVFFVAFLTFRRRGGGFAFAGPFWRGPQHKTVFFRVTFPNPQGQGRIHLPGPSLMHEDSSEQGPYYGELDHDSHFDEEIEGREILWDNNDRMFEQFAPSPEDDWFAGSEGYYFAFDDDEKRNPYHRWDDDGIAYQRHCRRTAFHRDLHINCNNFHQLDVPRLTLENGVNFIG